MLRIHQVDGLIDQVIFWNPVTGARYDMKADHDSCPLQSVGVIFDENDIWANIQNTEEPARLNYNLSNDLHWKRFFSSGVVSDPLLKQ